MGKIKVTFQSRCDLFMIPKLFPIIRCNGKNLIRYRTQQTFYRISSFILCSSIHFVNKGKPRFSFCQRYNGLFMSFTDNCIRFPIAHTETIINDGRSLVNTDPIFKVSSSLIGSITLLSFLFTP